ncbi:MAG: hypothetical protein COA58_01495 [Bacteroidetes bacterium]|nr:MAG: hypothetical protein COA58_01495 [Bacteroidota bacterium]
MKVACVGNMNNMLFVLCRYLRDEGIDCDLLLFNNEMDHFLPSNDTFDEDYTSYTKVLEWGDINSFKTTSQKKIVADLKEYDFIIATQAPAFMYKAGINIDVFVPAGGELIITPFLFDKLDYVKRLRQLSLWKFIRYTKFGIQKSIIINQEPFSEYFRSPLSKLRVLSKTYYFGTPFVYRKIYKENLLLPHRYRDLREKNDLIIVNQARQLWVTHDTMGHESKGSDVIIRGYSQFLKKKPKISSKLLLFEYGPDVDYTKALINELDISSNVIWLPRMQRKELMTFVKMADFACGEFKPGCIGGLTTWESLATGTCLLHYLNEKVVKFHNFTGPYPFINVPNASSLADTLNDFQENSLKYVTIGKNGEKWYEDNFEKRCMKEWLKLIEIKMNGGQKSLIKYCNEQI